jgi:hypothetical protein
MKQSFLVVMAAIAVYAVASVALDAVRADDNASPIFGVRIPAGYRRWELVAPSHEAGSLDELRVILGNGVSIMTYRAGAGSPSPTGRCSPSWPGNTWRRPWTTLRWARCRLSFPGPPRPSRSWSKIRKGMPRQAAGDSADSSPASPSTRHSTRRVTRAIRPMRRTTIWSLRDSHVKEIRT